MKLEPGRLTAIVFDVDGTLYRQPPLRRAMLVRLLGEVVSHPSRGIAALRVLQAYRRAQEHLREIEVQGGLAEAQLRLACERSGQTEEVAARIVARWMDEEPLPLLGRFVEPALRDLLSTARARGLRLGVLSDYPATAKLRAMGLAEFFDVVVSAHDPDVNRFKPHPSGLGEALRRLRATPGEALYVGDRYDVDGAVARALDVPCVIVGRREASSASDGWIPVRNHADLRAMLFSNALPANKLTP
jgi:FMN phosphatase YigB (HAD superfamily)